MTYTDPNFKQLDEKQSLVLGYIFEDAYLIDKNANTATKIGSFYGDPSFGLISSNLDWCLVGGSYLYIWQKGGQIIRLEEDELENSCKARQIAPFEVEVLIDPWSDKGGVWRLNIETFEMYQLNTIDKRHEAYSEDVEW